MKSLGNGLDFFVSEISGCEWKVVIRLKVG